MITINQEVTQVSITQLQDSPIEVNSVVNDITVETLGNADVIFQVLGAPILVGDVDTAADILDFLTNLDEGLNQ